MKAKTEKPAWTADQRACIEALAVYAQGHHHLRPVKPCGDGVQMNVFGELATFDFDQMTRLVLVAHAYAVRMCISPSGPGMLKVVAHKRQHSGPEGEHLHYCRRHPSLKDLSARAIGWAAEIEEGKNP